MNVYIRQLSHEMGQRAHTMDIFTRRTDAHTPEITVIDERTRVIQIEAGPPDAGKTDLRRFCRIPRRRAGLPERATAGRTTSCTATTGSRAGSARR